MLSSKGGQSLSYTAQVSCPEGSRSLPHAASAMGANTYSYDCNGNMTQRVIVGSTYNLAYDAENRLSTVSGAASASFVYDGDGVRVKSTVGGTTTAYIGSYYEWTGSSSTMKRYYEAGGSRIGMRQGSTLYWLLADHLGSTSVTANASGGLYGRLLYKSWGEQRWSSGTTPTTYRYTGQRSESSLGLYYYGARWYDPYLSRWTSPDPIIPGVGERGNANAVGCLGAANYSPLTVDYHEHQLLEQLNHENRVRLQDAGFRLPLVPTNSIAFDRYAYSLNNPIRYTDPTGHCPFCVAIALTIGAVTPVGWVVLGVATVATVAFVATGGPEAFGEALYQAGADVANGINVAFHKKDWIPDNLLPEYRGLWGRAAEKYKAAYPGLPRGFQLPKELARELADLLNEGKSIDEAVDEMPELDDFVDDDDSE